MLYPHSLLDTKGVLAVLGEGKIPRYLVENFHIKSRSVVNLAILFNLQVYLLKEPIKHKIDLLLDPVPLDNR